MRGSRRAGAALVAATLLIGVGGIAAVARGATSTDLFAPTPDGPCGPGSKPESTQGRVPAADFASGRAAQGYTCNTEEVAHFGTTGGYRTYQYVDSAGHRCAYYDTTLLFPANATSGSTNLTGVYALDMSNSHNPVHTASLLTPAMQSPHESLSLNVKRGLLAADMGYPTYQPGYVDIYDVSKDCRSPVLRSSLPMGVLGHEGGFAPDGNTFYASSAGGRTLTAIDVTNPAVPLILWTATNWVVHGLNVSDDGTRLYFADLGSSGSSSGTDGSPGLTILDASQVQARRSSPQVSVVSHLTWPQVSIPQTPIPVTITTGAPARPHRFLVEVDEFSKSVFSYNPTDPVGAARMISIDDERHPKVVSNMRLAVNTPAARAGDQRNDPGATSGLQGYAAHYCAVPSRVEPGIVACSFILSGLRVFDIRDPSNPKEIAYFNQPPPARTGISGQSGSYAMSAPSFVPEQAEIRYSDGNSGFYVVRVTNGVWPFKAKGRSTARHPARRAVRRTRRPRRSRRSSGAPASR